MDSIDCRNSNKKNVCLQRLLEIDANFFHFLVDHIQYAVPQLLSYGWGHITFIGIIAFIAIIE